MTLTLISCDHHPSGGVQGESSGHGENSAEFLQTGVEADRQRDPRQQAHWLGRLVSAGCGFIVSFPGPRHFWLHNSRHESWDLKSVVYFVFLQALFLCLFRNRQINETTLPDRLSLCNTGMGYVRSRCVVCVYVCVCVCEREREVPYYPAHVCASGVK